MEYIVEVKFRLWKIIPQKFRVLSKKPYSEVLKDVEDFTNMFPESKVTVYAVRGEWLYAIS